MAVHRETARRGDWVQIHRIVLAAGERAPQVPPDTQARPLEMWVKGHLAVESAALGDQVQVTTLAGRREEGRLVAVLPAYGHDFGEPVPELLGIGRELRAILAESPEEAER